MKLFRLSPILVILIIGLTSCGVIPTDYQPAGIMGGYSELQISPDTYVVTFQGNQSTNADTVQTYALRRAAELTVQAGYKYFAIQNAGTSNDSYVVQTPTRVVSSSNGFSSGSLNGTTNYYGNMAQSNYGFGAMSSNYSNATIYPSQMYVRNRYTTKILVKMYKSPNKKMQLLDPQIILRNFQK